MELVIWIKVLKRIEGFERVSQTSTSIRLLLGYVPCNSHSVFLQYDCICSPTMTLVCGILEFTIHLISWCPPQWVRVRSYYVNITKSLPTARGAMLTESRTKFHCCTRHPFKPVYQVKHPRYMTKLPIQGTYPIIPFVKICWSTHIQMEQTLHGRLLTTVARVHTARTANTPVVPHRLLNRCFFSEAIRRSYSYRLITSV